VTFLDKALELIGLLDLTRSRIRPDNRLVFLCGGKVDDSSRTALSARHALLRHLKDSSTLGPARIVLAERAVQALPGSNFTNLLDLEEYISGLVDAVIVFVESAGSICELGAFVKTDEIRRKLVVILSNEHNNTPSFITLGALNYFKDNSVTEPEIYPFHWGVLRKGVQVQKYVLDQIVTDMPEAINNVRDKGNLDLKKLGHRIYLALAFCHLLRGARLSEIKTCMIAAGCPVKDDEVVKYLSVLEICNLIVTVSHGKKLKVYVPLTGALPLRFAFISGTADHQRNILRWIHEISALVKAEDDRRIKIFQEHSSAA
jgi:hypothetical protein